MTEHYRFFNSIEGDVREYNASEFAEYFNRFISNGIFSENGNLGLRVSNTSGLGISVATGYAFIKGYMYHNDASLSFTLDNADVTLDRIDRVVLRFDEVNRVINVAVKKGILASSPIPPPLVNTSTLKELSLAQIRIKKGVSSIGSTDVIDERLTEFCGQVSMLIDVPITDMWNIWNNSLTEIQNDYDNWKLQYTTDWDTWANNTQQAWGDLVVARQSQLGVEVFNGTVEPVNAVAGDIWFKELV